MGGKERERREGREEMEVEGSYRIDEYGDRTAAI